MTTDQLAWHVAGSTAHLQRPEIEAALPLSEPQSGLQLLRAFDRQIDCQCFALPLYEEGKAILLDSFPRMNEVVAHYAETPQARLKTECLLRLRSISDDCVCLDHLVSVQTSTLDASPQIETTFRLPKGQWSSETFESGPLQLQSECGLTFALMTPQLDVASSSVESSSAGARARLMRFGKFLEKGVIRRGQLRLVVCPTDVASQVIADAHEDFLSTSPL